MKNGKKKITRVLAFLLSVVLFLTGIPIPVFAENPMAAYLDGWTVQAVWSNFSAKYVWDAQEEELREPKIIVTYRMDHAQKDYPAGSLMFTIPGIGGANRGKIEKARDIAAEKADSEWNCSWNEEQDLYVFSNKFSVEKGQSVSGGFELLWSFNSRNLESGFAQTVAPLFTAEGAGTVPMQKLQFQFTSARDRYRIDMQRDKIYDETYEASDPSYIWYEFETRFDKDWCARGLYRSDYYVTVELPEGQDYADVAAQTENGTYQLEQDAEGQWGFYPFKNVSGNLGGRYYTHYDTFLLGFKKEGLEGKEVTVHSHLDRLYQDDSMWIREAAENEVVDAELSFTVEDYHFTYTGYIYDTEKRNTLYEDYKRPPSYANRLNAVQMYSGKVVQFMLCGSANRSYSRQMRSRRATNSNAEMRSRRATDSDAEPIPEQAEDWNDLLWREHKYSTEIQEFDGMTYGERYPETLASDSDAEVFLIPDLVLRNPFRVKAYAAEATESNAARSMASPMISQIGEHQEYSMILGDDKLAVYLKNGSIRNLEDHEYDIAYVTVPADQKEYDYEIYGASSQDTPFEDYHLLEVGNTASREVWYLPDGIKAVFLRVNGVTGSYTRYAYVGVRLHLDWNEQQEYEQELRPDHENRLVNFSYLRALYVDEDGKEQNDCAVQSGNYNGIYGEKLAERDEDVYGEYLKRDYSNVWLRSAVTNLRAEASIADWTGAERDGFVSEIAASGMISADNTGNLEHFSVYAVLPNGVKEDLDDGIVRVKGAAVDKNGNSVSDFFEHMTISVRQNHGKTVLVADFDYSDNPLEICEKTEVTIHFPIRLSYEDYLNYGNQYTVTTYTAVHDGGIDQISGKAIMSDEYDLDGDGITSEKIAYAVADKVVLDHANEWREYAEKQVKSAYSEGYVTDTVTRMDSDYSYRLTFGVGSDHAKNIVFFDRLEQGAERQETHLESEWQGTLLSIDTSYAESLGMKPIIYYSEDVQEEYNLESSGWTTQIPEDLSTVRSIAVELNTDEMEGGVLKNQQMVFVVVHMRSPKDAVFCDKRAVNQYAVQYDAYGTAEVFEKTYQLTSSETTVRLLDSVGKITLQKVDADGKNSHAAITGAKFQIYDANGKTLFEEAKSLNSLGRIIIKNVPYGTYYWEEVQAPEGYQKLEGRHAFEIDGITEVLEIENHRIPGEAVLVKRDADSEEQRTIAGAVFELYRENGEQIFTDDSYQYQKNGSNHVFVTGKEGTFTVKGLPWGSYYFTEIEPPVGYERCEDKIAFTIARTQLKAEVTVENTQKTASILLRKVDEEDGSAIQGAVYSLYRNGEEIQSGLKTNAAGEIQVDNLKFGIYYFVETRNAGGYAMPDKGEARTELVFLDESTVDRVVTVRHTNERRLGTVRMQKTDDVGQLVGGAVYALYHQGLLYGTYQTESDRNSEHYGAVYETNLPWGDYYFQEIKAPQGYELSEEQISFTIDRNSVQNVIELNATDERMRGSVRLIKVDKEEPQLRLTGAVFELYRVDGTRCIAGIDYQLPEGSLRIETGEDGSITLTGIKQGGYYFQEIQAPESYSISDERIRFSITKENAAACQELTASDEKGKAVITIHKNINEVYEAFGNPTFIFRIAGSDGSTYMKTITLDEQNLTGMVRLEVNQGAVYTVTELPTARYRLEEIIPGLHASVNGTCAKLDLLTNTEGEVTFVNQMDQYEKFSHTDHAANIIRDMTKLTAIHVTYLGADPITPSLAGYDEETEIYTISKKDLLVMAHYDDGTSAEIPAADYTLSPETVNGNSDSYTGTITYTENGITRMASFSIGIALPVPLPRYTVSFELNGGMIVPDGSSSAQDQYHYSVKSGTQIRAPRNKPTLDGYRFVGWFCDTGLEQEAVFPDEIISDKTYYAKWEEKSNKVRYAVSIYGIGEDIDEQGNRTGLTFGPATNGCYISDYKAHVPNEEGQICMHDMSWEEIIAQSKENPTVFQECLEEGCTHGVDLVIKGPLVKGGSSYTNMKGDGTGMIYYAIGSNYRKWNRNHSEYITNKTSTKGQFEYERGCTYGGWPDSMIRNTLNGTLTENMLNISNKDNGFAETKLDESTALFAAFPEELKQAIVAKKVQSDTVYNNTSRYNTATYDKLWLFSGKELVKDNDENEGNCSIRPNEGQRYSRQDIWEITYDTPEKNTGYNEKGSITSYWLRSIYKSSVASYTAVRIRAQKGENYGAIAGSLGNNSAQAEYGLAPGFCLPGPESN